MSPARLEERVQINRRLNFMRRMQKADPSTAHFFNESIEELEAALRKKESNYEFTTI